jgi:2-oxoglutarate ferredoxin oxidoreductase subunit delta
MAMTAPAADVRPGRRAGGPPAFRPVLVAADRCKGCGLCIDVCQPGALAIDAGSVNAMGHHPVRLVDPDSCTSCARCARMCPDAALSVFARPREP